MTTPKKKEKRDIITFEAEDASVLDILERAKAKGRGRFSQMINEAIRECGDEALLKVLEREVEIAQMKLRDAQSSILRRRKH
ncbi:MAG: hypothetical protein ACTHLW_21530 [Verrucomicrobiota bacterium]